jgi:outer membrane biosynthesis protein TonB
VAAIAKRFCAPGLELTLDASFDESALTAVKKWTFEPAKCDGNPVLDDINVLVNFRY